MDDLNGGLPGDPSIQRLIEATEKRVKAEQRVGDILRAILESQSLCARTIDEQAKQIAALTNIIARLEAVLVMLAEYLATLANVEKAESAAIRQRLLETLGREPGHTVHVDSGGIRFGDQAKVDTRDMIGTKGKDD